MIVLRNLMMAIAAFFVAGYGFYFFLLHAMPPDKVQAMALSDTSVSASSSASIAGGVTASGDNAGKSSTLDKSSPLEKPSTLELAASVMDDFLAANRPAKSAGETPVTTPLQVPEWLAHRFDQEAIAGKQLTTEDRQALMTSLIELRQLKLQEMATSAGTQGGDNAADPRAAKVALAAKAVKAEWQFRQTLGIGLAEFMKKLGPDDLQRLLAIPGAASQTAPGKMADTADSHPG